MKNIEELLEAFDKATEKLNLSRANAHKKSVQCDREDCWCRTMKTFKKWVPK